MLRKIRAPLYRFIWPKSNYFFFTRTEKYLTPLSNRYGFDRGKPIDRYYIEKFLSENADCIKGRCLEVTDNNYTAKFGGNKVVVSDVLDIDTSNKLANIHGDIRNLKNTIKDDTYDCIILAQTLGIIDDCESVIKECYRILKPGGIILITATAISPVLDLENNYWRFTIASMAYVLKKYFSANKIMVNPYGNVLTGQSYWVGASQEELTKKQLEYNDPKFPVIITAKATK